VAALIGVFSLSGVAEPVMPISFRKGCKWLYFVRVGLFRKYAQVVENTWPLDRRIFIVGGGRAGHADFVW
jgi:hypothetical protein